ncbi:MAG: hypothetical protein BroJett040_15290 [Oligoflexia bacterium]|nr:MAG: hypothetical protein BroJett040_15290 [Oligoflexia bacterium]
MKRSFQILFFVVITFTLMALSTKVQASDYEEVSYDDLINRLNKKKSKVIQSQSSSPLDDIMIHAGFGLVTTVSNVNFGDRNYSHTYNGFQLSFGIDLFSPDWVAEGAIRNYGNAQTGSEYRTLRETDMKVMYRGKTSDRGGYRLGTGLATRYFKVNDPINNVHISDTTPSALFFGGIDASINRHFGVGIEVGYRSAMVNYTSDKNSVDFMLRMDSFF